MRIVLQNCNSILQIESRLANVNNLVRLRTDVITILKLFEERYNDPLNSIGERIQPCRTPRLTLN